MRKLTTGLCLLLALVLTLAGCGGADDGPSDAGRQDGELRDGSAGGDLDLEAWPSGKYLSCEEVRAYQLAADPRMLLLNVVDEEFYGLGHIEGSLVIPWDLLPDRLDEVDGEKHIVIYCRRGVRSEAAYDTLEGAGYGHLWVMESGIERWIELGYPTVD